MSAFERLGQIWRFAKYGLPLARTRPDSPRTVADVFEEQAAARGAHPFVLFEDRRVTYDELNREANRVAHWALAQGLGHGQRVALLMHNRPEFLWTWAGLSKAGVTTALINTNLGGRALEHAITTADAKHLIAGGECLAACAPLGASAPWQLWVSDEPGTQRAELPAGAHDFAADLATRPSANPPPGTRAECRAGDDLFYIYTSGTTGLPKAARFSHLRFMTAATASRLVGFEGSGVMYCALPLYHTAGGCMAVGAALLSGGSLALRRRFSAREFWSDVRRFRATSFQYIGEFCRYLLNQPADPLDGRHELEFCIGNGLRPDIWVEFRDRFKLPRIVEFYGATEGNVSLLNLDNKVGSVGRIPTRLLMDARVVRYDVERDEHPRDAHGHLIECKPDEAGELIGAMPTRAGDTRGRFEGYTSKEATERKILRNAFKDGDAFFRTGDLLKHDAQGYFYFVDRIGDTFRWKGENVSTQEVAECLAHFPGVEMANVYGVEVAGADGRAGMVALVLAPEASFDPRAFYAHAVTALPAYATPVFVRLQKDAEVTGTFKLRKVELQQEGYDLAKVRDPLFVRDDGARAYVPFDAEAMRKLAAGQLRV
ncbi:MAG TPA: long-chain-acyl-CoA synthetase [Myxococcota bacterium]|nr:long-chain-acyl-CoA synthetase [Myxococcota bacterium]